MNKAGKLLTLSVFVLLLCFSAGSALAEDYVYVTTNMTWAEFYAGELGQSSSDLAVSYDAVSTATQRFATRFGAFDATLSGDGTVFEGVKDVQVRMTEEVWNSLVDNSRFSKSDSSFDEYKEMDAEGNFGKMITETVKAADVSVAISGGKSTGHGNYRIALTGLSYDVVGANLGTNNDNFLGVKLETSDGTVYGMKPLHNLWIRGNMAEQIGFCVEDFSERNGTHLSFAHTADLPGKTIEKITYMLKNQPDIVIDCELFVKKWTDAAIKVSGSVRPGSNVTVTLTSSDVPSDAAYSLASVAKVVGRTSTPLTEGTDYTYSNGKITFTNLESGTYSATFTSSSYVDVVASINAYYYATTDMTWAEFYAGELNKTSADLLSAGLDAVSSSTARIANGQTQLTSVSNDIGGRSITGVKAVQVRFEDAAYAALKDNKRFTFVDYDFTQYKPVNSDGSFGAMVSETETRASADVTVTSGGSSTWGSYTLAISGVGDLVLTSGDQRYFIGAVLETESGDKFGLRHNNNLWMNLGTVSITVNDKYVEPHGVTRDYKYTASLEGQTVTKLTFLIKNQPSIVVNCSAKLKTMSDSSVSLSADVSAGLNVPISFKFDDLHDGVVYSLKALYSGSGRGRTLIENWTYSDGILTVNGVLAGGTYQAVFETDDYSDITLTFSVAETYHYATADMTWAEFYAGELGETSAELLAAGLDAVSSPTARIARGQTQLTSVSNDIGGRSITGVKAVQVRMTEALYNTLSNDSRFTFTDETFAQYKNLNSDGSFGAMVTETETRSDAVVTVSAGANSTWGSYTLSISGLGDVKLTSGDQRYYLGAVLETKSGDKFGLRHNNNLWMNLGTVAITVNDKYVEPHGVKRDYKYTKSLDGQTVSKITFFIKNQPSIIVNCSAYLTPIGNAKISVSNDVYLGVDEPISFKFLDLPDGVVYNLKAIYNGTGRGRTLISEDQYTYDDGTLSMDISLPLGKYLVIFEDKNGNYADLSVIFEVKDAFYGTTDMTWAEFFAGEFGVLSSDLAASYDAVSTATVRFATRFGAFNATASSDGTVFEGVKDVQVRIPLNIYNTLTEAEKSRFTTSSSSFTEYKEVNAYGSFGEMLTEIVYAKNVLPSMDVSISGGQATTHGNYRITLTGLDYAKLGAVLGTSNDNFLGVKLKTSDDAVYGMKPLHNLWIRGNMAEQIGFAVVDFAENNGTLLSYAHTADLPGKTIKTITYMLKNQPDIVISCDLFVKKWTDATVSVSGNVGSGTNVAVTLVSSDVPSDAAYSLSSVAKVAGRTSTPVTDYSYSGNTLTFPVLEGGSYTATFTSDTYVDLVARITVTPYYATADMTWAEFYAGELGQTSDALLSAGLDAVSSPTARIANGQTQLTSVSNDLGGRSITGVKAVQVKMTEAVYNVLSSDKRFTFSDEVFDQYKPVNSDGSFGAMVTETETRASADVTVSAGASSTWGSYTLSISGLGDVKLTSGDERYFIGAVLETSDGSKYGLRHNNNLWMNLGTVSITVNDSYVEPHGVTRDYKYTASLEGQTVTKITFFIKNQPSIVVNCSAKLVPMSTSTITLSADVAAGVDVPIAFKFADLPDGIVYTLKKLYSGSGRGRVELFDWTYDDGVLKVNGSLPAGQYQAIFGNDEYSDIAVIFDVYHYATTDMTWAEFYAGEIGETSADLLKAGLDAVSSPTARIANRFTQLTSESNDLGGRSITGVKAVQVRMNGDVYKILSEDERFTFVDEAFTEFKDTNSDGSFGKMVTETHVQEDAVVTLTIPGTWGDYVLTVSSIDIPVMSGDEYIYLGALVETSDGSVYGMRHNSNLWFSAGSLAISTAEFVEPHGVSRDYAYTSDLEGKTITKITYMLKNLPDEIVSCDVFLKLKTDASVAPVYDEGYHAVIEGSNVQVKLKFSDIPSSADYSLLSVTSGTRQNRRTYSGSSMSGDVLTIAGNVGEGTYTATFVDETYANITATIQVYSTNATDKIISADKNLAQLTFLLTPKGVSDSTDAVLDAQNFVNATECKPAASTSLYNGGIQGSGFSLEVKLNDVPTGKRGIVGFSQAFPITPDTIGSRDFTALSAKILALPDVAYGWRVPTGEQLKDMGLTVVGIYPGGVSRDITGYVSSGLLPSTGAIMMSYGTVLIDREFTPSEEGKVYQLSEEGEGTMSDGRKDDNLTATWYVTFTSSLTPTSPDVPVGPISPDVPKPTVPTVKPSNPSQSLTTETKQSEIREKLGNLSSKVTADTPIEFGIPENAIQGEQSVSSPESDVVYLPVIEVDEAKVYVFGVSLDNLVPGDRLFWNSNAVDVETGEFVSAADAEEAVVFFNSSGVETEVVPSDRFVNVAAYLEPGLEYSPTITTVDDGVTGVSSSSGGCNSFASALMLSLLLIQTRTRRRH